MKGNVTVTKRWYDPRTCPIWARVVIGAIGAAAFIHGCGNPAAHAVVCDGGGYSVGGVCCAFNPWGGGFVATIPQPSGPPIYVGNCNGGLRTPPQFNYGRGPWN